MRILFRFFSVGKVFLFVLINQNMLEILLCLLLYFKSYYSFCWQYCFFLIQDLELPSQILYHFSNALNCFSSGYFSDKVLHILLVTGLRSRSFYLWLPVAGITDVYHHSCLVCWYGGLTNFLLGLISNCHTSDLCQTSKWNCTYKALCLVQVYFKSVFLKADIYLSKYKWTRY
jgi:hypothetical protein